jgi:hypothetical protein
MKIFIISVLIRAIKSADEHGLNPLTTVSNGGIKQQGNELLDSEKAGHFLTSLRINNVLNKTPQHVLSY